jgi:hypothetical protein
LYGHHCREGEPVGIIEEAPRAVAAAALLGPVVLPVGLGFGSDGLDDRPE